MKTLSNFSLKNKTVLLRADLNSNVHKGRVLMSERIRQNAETIKILKKKKAKIIVIAHQGRPGKSDFLSLKQHAKLLNKFTKIKFIDDIIGKKSEKAIKNLRVGDAILLDNIRKQADEFKPFKKNNKLLKLTEKADIYINNSFSVCHRKQTSIISFPKYMKSCAGPLLEEELAALKKIKIKNCLYILGGAKPEDNIKLLKGNKVLACGLFGQLCLIAKGKNLGAQNKYLKKEVKDYNSVVKKLKNKLRNVETPVDFAIKINGKRKEISLDEFPSKYEIFDIGSETMKKYVDEIKKAKSIYMKGPAGYYTDRKFFKGTLVILRAVVKNKGFSLIGGGHLSDAVEASGISKNKFGYISLSGGALLNYIAGEKLPGLDVLK